MTEPIILERKPDFIYMGYCRNVGSRGTARQSYTAKFLPRRCWPPEPWCCAPYSHTRRAALISKARMCVQRRPGCEVNQWPYQNMPVWKGVLHRCRISGEAALLLGLVHLGAAVLCLHARLLLFVLVQVLRPVRRDKATREFFRWSSQKNKRKQNGTQTASTRKNALCIKLRKVPTLFDIAIYTFVYQERCRLLSVDKTTSLKDITLL